MNSYGMSHKGYVRKENEDAYCIEDKTIGALENLYVIADGMGGHRGGSVASKMAVDQLFSAVTKLDGPVEMILRDGISYANHAIYSRAVEDSAFFGMGTTVEAVTVTNEAVYVGHVGDSRVYICTQQAIHQITKDHSYVQELVDAGVITQEEAEVHPNKNRITRALGVGKEVDIEIYKTDRTTDNAVILMCSDGLTNMVDLAYIKSVVMQDISLKERCNILMDEALEQGGIDNITLVLVEIEGRA